MHIRQYGRNRPSENKPHRTNLPPRDYEDEQESLQPRHGDTAELKDLKGKMKVLVGKLAISKKEKDALQKENQQLQKEVMNLQNSLRHMVAGFSNTTSSFPMTNQLTTKISEFYKYECLDTFFDLLGPEQLTLKGVIYFYLQTFSTTVALVDNYFQPAFEAIKTTGCLQSLEGPVINVLRKAFQTKHQTIIPLIAKRQQFVDKAEEIIDSLGISCTERRDAVEHIVNFFQQLISLMLQCRISDPPLMVDVAGIGKRVEFNGLIHDPFDGFIKAKEDCFVILPEVRKYESNDVLVKGLVLHKSYDLSN